MSKQTSLKVIAISLASIIISFSVIYYGVLVTLVGIAGIALALFLGWVAHLHFNHARPARIARIMNPKTGKIEAEITSLDAPPTEWPDESTSEKKGSKTEKLVDDTTESADKARKVGATGSTKPTIRSKTPRWLVLIVRVLIVVAIIWMTSKTRILLNGGTITTNELAGLGSGVILLGAILLKYTFSWINNFLRIILGSIPIGVFTFATLALVATLLWNIAKMVPGIILPLWLFNAYCFVWILLFIGTGKFSSKDYVKPGNIGVARFLGKTLPFTVGEGFYFWYGTVTETPDVVIVANLFGHNKGSDDEGMQVLVLAPTNIPDPELAEEIGLRDNSLVPAILKSAVDWKIVDHPTAQRNLGIKDSGDNFTWNPEVENNLFKKILPKILAHIRAVVSSYPFDQITSENSDAVKRINKREKPVDMEQSSLYELNQYARKAFGIEVVKISLTKIVAKDQAIADLIAGGATEQMQRRKEKADAQTSGMLIRTVMNSLGYKDVDFAQLEEADKQRILRLAEDSKPELAKGGASNSGGIDGASGIAIAKIIAEAVKAWQDKR